MLCQQVTSVYDMILSAFETSLSALNNVEDLEEVLLENLLNESPYRSQLATDLWVILSR